LVRSGAETERGVTLLRGRGRTRSLEDVLEFGLGAAVVARGWSGYLAEGGEGRPRSRGRQVARWTRPAESADRSRRPTTLWFGATVNSRSEEVGSNKFCRLYHASRIVPSAQTLSRSTAQSGSGSRSSNVRRMSCPQCVASGARPPRKRHWAGCRDMARTLWRVSLRGRTLRLLGGHGDGRTGDSAGSDPRGRG
jgi:hypothetical protein